MYSTKLNIAMAIKDMINVIPKNFGSGIPYSKSPNTNSMIPSIKYLKYTMPHITTIKDAQRGIKNKLKSSNMEVKIRSNIPLYYTL